MSKKRIVRILGVLFNLCKGNFVRRMGIVDIVM